MSTEATTGSLTFRVPSALLGIIAPDPERTPRLTLWVIAILFALLLLWTCVARLDIIAVAEGRLVPQTYLKIVQPPDAGIVREILVSEGDRVEKGQVLVRLDPTESAADSVATAQDLAIQRLQLRRVDAELKDVPLTQQPGEDPQLFAQAEAQRAAHRQQFVDSIAQESATRDRSVRERGAAAEMLRKLEKTLPAYQRSAEAYEKLSAQHLVGSLDADSKRREATEKAQDLEAQRATVSSLESAIAQSQKRLAQLQSTYESDLHATRLEATRRLTELERQRAKIVFHQENLALRAPQAGTIKDLATTSVGSVVQPGTVLLTLVPANEPLFAEVSIQNQDIGFVREGQAVRLKLATYPFQKYGMLDGTVKTIIADSNARDGNAKEAGASASGGPPAGSMIYKAVVQLSRQELKMDGRGLRIAAGMQLQAEILEGQRTVLEYLLSPVQRVTHEAAMER